MAEGDANQTVRTVGRYAIHAEIASGGMATVHLGRLMGAAGFARTVAIKRMHADLAKDPEFVSMFVDEARLAARIHHPNVVSTLDVVALSGELFVVMEYVHGESLATLTRAIRAQDFRMPLRVALRIAGDLLAGLHAAHEAKSEDGEPLGVVHRDVSPQNVLVGADGVTRIIDFGVAKAAGRVQTTREGQIKGKLAYMSPEQLLGERVDRRSDVYSASVVLWEMLTGTRLFLGENQGHTMRRVLAGEIEPPGRREANVPPGVDAIVMRGLERSVGARFATALEMSLALEAAMTNATTNEVADWMKRLAGAGLDVRAGQVRDVEHGGPSASGTQSDVVRKGDRLVVRSVEATSTTVSASMSTSSAAPARRSRRVWLGLALVFAAVGATALFVRGRTPVATVSTAARPAGGPAEDADDPAAAPASATSPPMPLAASTASAGPAGSPGGHGTGPWRSKSPAAPRPAANCNPPFLVDAQGVRTYKRECLAQ